MRNFTIITKVVIGIVSVAISVSSLNLVNAETNSTIKTKKISPQIKKSKVADTDNTPQFDLKPFTVNFRLLTEDENSSAPKIYKLKRNLSAQEGNEILVKDLAGRLKDLEYDAATSIFAIYRPQTELYKQFSTSDAIGFGALKVGTAKIKSYHQATDITTLVVEKNEGEILINDLLLPVENNTEIETIQNLSSEAPGVIVDTIQSIYSSASYQFVFVDIGSDQGLVNGAILKVRNNPSYYSELIKITKKRDREVEKIPSLDPIGTIVLIKVYPKGSYGIITNATTNIRKFDLVNTK
ncbi:MAG: hypothetical protein QM538_03390 [Methylacidiphilales bacterium]|nr:hypothetical protein [Candidatus Methylacidiphilales bacterium]